MPIDSHPRSHPEDRNEGNLNPDPILICWECADEYDLATAEVPEASPERNPLSVMAEEAGSPPGMGPEEWDRLAPGGPPHAPSGEAGDDDGAGNISPRESLERYGQEDVDGLEMAVDWTPHRG